MEYEAFKFRSVIFWDKSRLIRHHISVVSYGGLYDFIIDSAGHNALDIVAFFKYREIINSNNTLEKQLHEIISSRITNPRVLKDTAYENRFDLYNTKVYFKVNGYTYTFKVDGIGPQAVKITAQITYDDIVFSNNEIESSLRSVIKDKYSSKFNDAVFIKRVDTEWEENEAHKNEVKKEVMKEEEIRLQKQKELEDFLNS